jgi:hypothetical protein
VKSLIFSVSIFVCIVTPVPAATRWFGTLAAPDMRTLVYASADRSNGDIDVFSNLGGHLATLPLPAETATYAGFEQIAARPGTGLYVGATYFSAGTFTVEIFGFAPGATQSTQTLDDGTGIIQAMVVAKNGELAICRTVDAQSVIDFFEPGATSVSRSISNSPLEDVFGAAYGPDGTLWLAGLLRGGTLTFAYVSPGDTTVVPAFPAPATRGFSDELTLAIDGRGRLVFEARGTLAVYSTSGRLERTIVLAGRPKNIRSIAFSRDFRQLYVADPDQNLETFAYPDGGSALHVFNVAASAVAVGTR